MWAQILEHCERIAKLETKVNALLWLGGVGVPVLVGIFLKLVAPSLF